MSTARHAVTGILVVVLSAGLILGSVVIAMNEWNDEDVLDPSVGETQMAVRFAASQVDSPLFLTSAPQRWTATPTTTRTSTPSPTRTATMTGTSTHTPTICPLPDGWQVITLTPEDTIELLADRYMVSIEELLAANCLGDPNLTVGMDFYVPLNTGEVNFPRPHKTHCGPPAGWVMYTVQHGDTLYSLSLAMGIHYTLLQAANCMGSATLIRSGQKLWVPYIPTSTPAPTAIPSATLPPPSTDPSPTPAQVDTPPVDTPIPTDTADPG